jgi:hypothetical protein
MMICIVVAAWILFSLFIAIVGRHYRFGFWGYFFGSILLSPVIGLLLLLAATPFRGSQLRGTGRI